MKNANNFWTLLGELNSRSKKCCAAAMDEAGHLEVREIEELAPASVLDFGVNHVGTIAGGLLLARICVADLAALSVHPPTSVTSLAEIQVVIDHPVEACIASQYAGWPFSFGGYFAMCSGPARVARGNESLLIDYGLLHQTEHAVGVFESAQIPNREAIEAFASQCRLAPHQITLCIARTASLPGTIQVVARSVETTMHKLHEIQFDLRCVKRAIGTAPLPPIGADDLQSLGWTNDAILYGSRATLWVDADDSQIARAGERLPSCTSADYGKPFREIFERYDRDFYKIDRMLFSPAEVTIHSLKSGRTFVFGKTNSKILCESFGIR
jgi:methenyltetrahydromethanopterin cyclohydrolase